MLGSWSENAGSLCRQSAGELGKLGSKGRGELRRVHGEECWRRGGGEQVLIENLLCLLGVCSSGLRFAA